MNQFPCLRGVYSTPHCPSGQQHNGVDGACGCVPAGTRQPILILEELSRLANQPPGVADLTSEIRQKYRHWLLHFPAQCVVTAECILWERSMARTLEKTDPDELRALR